MTTKPLADANKPATAGVVLLKAGDVVTNSIGMKLVYIPAGKFMMRSGSWDNGANRMRCSYRSDYPVSRGLLVGFRVVRSNPRTAEK